MTTDDLLSYIRTQVGKDMPRDLIFSRLAAAGWNANDVEEAWNIVQAILAQPKSQTSQQATETKSTPGYRIDPYREVPDGSVIDESTSPMRVPLEKPAVFHPVEPKVWTPTTPPVIEVSPKPVDIIEKPIEIPKIIPPIASPVTPAPIVAAPITPSLPKIPQVVATAPVVEQSVVKPVTEIPPQPEVKQESDVKEIKNDTLVQEKPWGPPVVKPITPLAKSTQASSGITPPQPPVKNSISNIFSNKAMISSYQSDVLSTTKVEEQPSPKNTKKIVKWVIIGVIAVLVIIGTALAIANGIVKVPLVVRKDPTTALLVANTDFDSLKSYKTETTLTLSTPSLANITTGLVNGQVVKSNDQESLVADVIGSITNKTATTPMSADYSVTVKSSLMQDPIVSDIKSDGSTSYVNVPLLNELLGVNTPPPALVTVHPGDVAQILPQLPQDIQDFINRVDTHHILSQGLPANSQSQINDAIKTFIQNVQITQSAQEDIKGIPTYHYQFTADHQTTKTLLSSIASIFIGSLPSDEQQNLDAGLGSVSFDSFDVWVGRDDGAVHQYQFTLTAPLSKVIALNDSGIAGNQVNLTWEKTYYDFDVPNTIVIPTGAISMQDFVKSIVDVKIKNAINSFGDSAKSLSNAEGHFGRTSNPSGSCTAPNAGSLFSPVGHAKGAITQLSIIATTMQTLLGATNNVGSCYSTPSSWAIAFPLASDPSSYYCADSTGATTVLPGEIKGTVCK